MLHYLVSVPVDEKLTRLFNPTTCDLVRLETREPLPLSDKHAFEEPKLVPDNLFVSVVVDVAVLS